MTMPRQVDPMIANRPDESVRLIWQAFDTVERLADRSPALARQAARAALEAAREIEELNRQTAHTPGRK